MYVCLCHGVTEKDLKNSINKGNRTFCDIMDDIKIAKQCKKCVPSIVSFIKEENRNIIKCDCSCGRNQGEKNEQ